MVSRPRLREPRGDRGFVIVPVIMLLALMLVVGFALLTVVDTQTGQGRATRGSDAAQALAEGAVTAAANVLASDATLWQSSSSGSCQTVTGNLATAPPSPAVTLADRVSTEIRVFAGSSADYSAAGGRTATWKVSICPPAWASYGGGWSQDGETRWDDSFLTRYVEPPPPVNGPAQLAVWIRGQASVANAVGTTPARSRAVVSKAKQNSTTFTPPLGYAIGTGVFGSDLSTGLNTTLLANGTLLGDLLGRTLGTNGALIAPTSAIVGVRCGLLNTLSATNSVCLTGTFAGAYAVTNALGLGQLGSALGTNRTQALATWTMAPADAIAGYRAASLATPGGLHKNTVAGTGNVSGKVPGDNSHDCLSASEATSSQTVVYIDQVGDGNQYCTLSGTRSAKIFVVAKGGVRVTGAFTGVVYALNQGECAAANGACTKAERKGASGREAVRIEGNSGSVTGSVWVDGAGGGVGLYPTFSPSSDQLVDSIGGASGICGASGLQSVITGLGNVLTGILNGLGNLIGGRVTRFPGGGTNPGACALLKAKLRTLPVMTLQDIYQRGTAASGNTITLQVSEHVNCTLLVLCGSNWSADAQDYVTVVIPPLLGDTTLIGQLDTLLASTLKSGSTPYTAVKYDQAITQSATAQIVSGGGPLVGTYRNVAPN